MKWCCLNNLLFYYILITLYINIFILIILIILIKNNISYLSIMDFDYLVIKLNNEVY